MATSSIYREVRIKDRASACSFVKALENAEAESEKLPAEEASMVKCIRELKGKDIKEMFISSKKD